MGVYLLFSALVLLALLVVWQHNQEPSEEYKQQKEQSERLHKDLDAMDRTLK
jgi:sensor domain CHASE-containing protein